MKKVQIGVTARRKGKEEFYDSTPIYGNVEDVDENGLAEIQKECLDEFARLIYEEIRKNPNGIFEQKDNQQK